MSFYRRLLEFKNKKESLYSFSARIGISYNTLVTWKNGASPKIVSVAKLAKKLNCSPGWLGFGDKESQGKAA